MIDDNMKKYILEKLDSFLYNYLKDNVDLMPKRFIKLIANYYTDARIRKLYWEKLGVKMGTNSYPNLGFQTTTNGKDMVIIGDNVSIAPNVILITESCANNGYEINKIPYVKDKLTKVERIIIENEVWIGANVTILPGVTIGKCSVIGAGSIVIENIDPYSIYAGTPAKKLKNLDEPTKPHLV
jgi:acetyltransferase-like isoleucine patch superfamily enzyme